MNSPLKEHISQATFIKAPAEKVYDTLTSAKAWDDFFTTGMELDAKPGGKMIWRWKDWGPDFYTLSVDAKVLEADRPRRFAFEWGNKRRSTVEIDLKEEHGGTTLRLKEHGYLDTPEDRAMILECAAGWGEAMTLLKFYIEHSLVYSPPEKPE
ncbi:MAG: SRPBCC domain-containing protein [Candidatus Zixiibacteriota bacterium]|nr:MAG: SRPBCC domain-containing protein [candidate division Zixibacteria bacterium]